MSRKYKFRDNDKLYFPATQKPDYTHYHPVEAGFVEKPEDICTAARKIIAVKWD